MDRHLAAIAAGGHVIAEALSKRPLESLRGITGESSKRLAAGEAHAFSFPGTAKKPG
jgi:hypothetical protein